MSTNSKTQLELFTETFFASHHIVRVGLGILQFEPEANDPFYIKLLADGVDLEPVQVLRDVRRYRHLGMVVKSAIELKMTEPINKVKLLERTDHSYWNIVETIGRETDYDCPPIPHVSVYAAIDLEVQP